MATMTAPMKVDHIAQALYEEWCSNATIETPPWAELIANPGDVHPQGVGYASAVAFWRRMGNAVLAAIAEPTA